MPELRFPVDENDHVIGDPAARVTLLEYGDYQCPHCQAAQPVVTGLLRRFGRDLRLAYRHFPIVSIHPFAEPAAEAAEYAGSMGHFWEMHEALFDNGHRLSLPTLLLVTAQIGLSPEGLRQALVNRSFAAKVEQDFAGGVRSGVNGTPCFFVNGRRQDGPHDTLTLGAAIDEAMRAPPAARLRTRA